MVTRMDSWRRIRSDGLDWRAEKLADRRLGNSDCPENAAEFHCHLWFRRCWNSDNDEIQTITAVAGSRTILRLIPLTSIERIRNRVHQKPCSGENQNKFNCPAHFNHDSTIAVIETHFRNSPSIAAVCRRRVGMRVPDLLRFESLGDY